MKARRVAPISTSWQGWHADPSSPGSPAIWCRMVTARQPRLPLSQHITRPQQPPPPLPPHLHHCGWMSDTAAAKGPLGGMKTFTGSGSLYFEFPECRSPVWCLLIYTKSTPKTHQFNSWLCLHLKFPVWERWKVKQLRFKFGNVL